MEDKFSDIMELVLPENADSRWCNVTIDMLLCNKAGFEDMTLDIDHDDVFSYGTNDYLAYVLSFLLPKQYIEAVYTDVAFYLLSLVVEKVSGQTLYDFLRPILMDILAFSEYAWSACPKGHTMSVTGLFVRCEDMVKIGQIYLENGVYQG